MKRSINVLLVALVPLAACSTTLPAGSMMHTIARSEVPQRPRHRIAVYPPRDLRPALERRGDEPRFTAFIFALVFAHFSLRGNLLTDDRSLSPNLTDELGRLARGHLAASGAFRAVTAAPPTAEFGLSIDILHLYATQYRSASATVIASHQSSSTFASGVAFATYGNAVVALRLYDLRRGTPQLFWQRTIVGTANETVDNGSLERFGKAARAASRDALQQLPELVRAAIARYAPPTFDRAGFAAQLQRERADGSLTFFVERLAKDRSAIEQLTVHHGTGRILGQRVVPAVGQVDGRPLEWMLSHRRVDGSRMAQAEYEQLARFVAASYDLRRVDNLFAYHFCGKRKLVSARAGH